ncbi:SRPBCC family protein [Pseudofrankia sp. BMG5.37]|uniref:SRPBCC family protein n=1 Tax=Pseudofrankia sp. BMG5.37 TaxID=3050035 RepID=UPI0037C64DEE
MAEVISELPFVDEHATVVDAAAEDVWLALAERLDRSFGGAGAQRYARAVGCAECAPSGPRPLATGSTIVGFRVVAAEPGSRLMLAGRHRFSDYTLTFRLDDAGGGRTRLRAETRAAFPGILGRTYRLLVIGSGGHVAGLRRLLAATRRQAEHTGLSDGPTAQID